jgi:hypothetical protein
MPVQAEPAEITGSHTPSAERYFRITRSNSYPTELRERAIQMYRSAEPKPVIRQMARQLGVHLSCPATTVRTLSSVTGVAFGHRCW